MKNTLLRTLLGIGSAGLLTAAALTLGSPVATADPLTELLCGSGSAQLCPPPAAPPQAPPSQPNNPRQPNNPPSQVPPSPSYKNCTEVRNAGKAPLLRGQPGYAPHLDRDDDGVACE
ncbi:excalibur calcium-binding domain-containing protein [Nocardia gipuzkoensis]|uniref:excalibur calcium-binding domain-containing protein n=1 Tax=Nocardia gipuzkoensis TaxID=2749991 RepID=UPI0015EF99AE|nr:excalibur calcium-binding domain-containing protein [Nocardia gipuzkoensis]